MCFKFLNSTFNINTQSMLCVFILKVRRSIRKSEENKHFAAAKCLFSSEDRPFSILVTNTLFNLYLHDSIYNIFQILLIEAILIFNN
jgi:hypothetical protein